MRTVRLDIAPFDGVGNERAHLEGDRLSPYHLGCAVACSIVPLVSGLLGWNGVSTLVAMIFCFEIAAHVEGTPTGVLRLFDKFKCVAIHAVAVAALKLVLVAAVFCVVGSDVVAIACVYCAADIIKSVSLFAIALFVVGKRVGLRGMVTARRRDLPEGFFSFTMWSNLVATADAPIQYFDVFFLSMLSSEVVGVFKFFKQLLSAFTLLSTPVQRAIMPQLAELIAKGQDDRAYAVVEKIERTVFKVVAPCATLAIISVPSALSFFMDPVYGGYWYLFVGLAALTVVNIIFSALHPCFTAYGLSKECAGITLLANVIYLVACCLLLGVMGIMAILLAMGVQYGLTIGLKSLFIKKVVLA